MSRGDPCPPRHIKTQVVKTDPSVWMTAEPSILVFEPQQFKYIRRVDIDRSQVWILAFFTLIETSLSTSMLVGRQSIFSGNILHILNILQYVSVIQSLYCHRDTSRPCLFHREHGARLRGLGSSLERQDQMLNTLLDGIPGALDPLAPDMAVHCAEVVAACLHWRFFYGVS